MLWRLQRIAKLAPTKRPPRTSGLSVYGPNAEGNHAHGLNERIRVQSLLDGRRFLHALVKRYADAAPAAR